MRPSEISNATEGRYARARGILARRDTPPMLRKLLPPAQTGVREGP